MKKLSLLVLLLSLPLAAAAPNDPLALVPADATAVGMLRLADMRSSPWGARLFTEADHVTIGGDGARFLAEARLRPTEDIDTIVFAATAGAPGGHGSGFAILEGRFEQTSVENALLSRKAEKKTVPGGTLLLLPEQGTHGPDAEPGALAFLDRHLAVVGPQPAVEAVLAQAASGSRPEFRTGAGLGRSLGRIPNDATAWVLVDLARQPMHERKGRVEGEIHTESRGGQVVQIASLMKKVPILALSATLKPDALALHAFGFCEDAETRDLLEDSLRGLLAAWRLSVQDSKPELVPVLRSFKVDQAKDGVVLVGRVPGSALEALFDRP